MIAEAVKWIEDWAGLLGLLFLAAMVLLGAFALWVAANDDRAGL